MRADPLPRALRRERFAVRTAPLGVAAIVGLALLLVDTPALLALAIAGVIAIWTLGYLVPWERLPRWSDLALPMLLLVLLTAIRDHMDPRLPPTTIAPLFLVPAFWVALFGSRRDVIVMLVAMSAARIAPPLFHGDDSDLARGVATIVVSATVCVLTHRVVDRSRESEQALRAILDAGLDGVAIIDRDRHGIYANPAYLELFALDAARFAGITRADFITHAAGLAEDPVDFARRFASLSDGDEDTSTTFAFVRPRRRIMRRTVRPIDLPRGPGFLVVWHEVTADHDLALERERLAMTDPLTGLANRRSAELALEREEARARRTSSPLSLAVLDLDHFKRINDEHGHDTGDRVLAAVGVVLHEQARGTDTIARWGGEEFLAVLPGDASGARAYCERVRAALAELSIPPVGALTLSAGVALLGADEDVQQALKRADERLYEAKRAGRDRIAG